MQITAIEILWLMLATSTATGLLVILSAAVTGYLLFRTKREQHETLFPAKMRKRNGPIVMDEFANEVDQDSEEGLPPVVRKMNERMGAAMALAGLKKESR